MRLYIISALAIAFLAILFALQNTNLVTVNLFVWNYQQSLALVLLGTLAIGVIVGLLVSIPAVIRRGWRVSRFQKQADTLTELIQDREQSLAAESRKVQAVHQSYRSLLSTLDLIEPHTGLLQQSRLPQALTRQIQRLQAATHDDVAPSLSVILLQVMPETVDGAEPATIWRAIATTLQQQASVDTWFYSDGQGRYVATTPGLDAKGVSQYGEKFQTAVLDQPPTLADGHQVSLEISVGGAIATGTTVDAPTLLSTAQTALEQAQQRGKNRLRVLEATG
jgi:uncharacterized integral membrane protein